MIVFPFDDVQVIMVWLIFDFFLFIGEFSFFSAQSCNRLFLAIESALSSSCLRKFLSLSCNSSSCFFSYSIDVRFSAGARFRTASAKKLCAFSILLISSCFRS